MNRSRPAARHNERSNLRGALITLIIEAAVVVMLGGLGLGISFLMLWIAG